MPAEQSEGNLQGAAGPAAVHDAEAVYSAIKNMILDGVLKAGEPVSQLALTRSLRVSRTPVREALRRLQAEGLVIAERNRRMLISSLSPSDIDAIYSARIFLESMGVALTVPLLRDHDREELLQASHAIVWDRDNNNPQAHDTQLSQFKRLLMKYAGEGVLNAISEQFDRCERVRQVYKSVAPSALAIAMQEHHALLQAALDRDVERAVFSASRHLGRTALAVIGYLAPDYEPRAVRFALAQTSRILGPKMSEAVLTAMKFDDEGTSENKPAGKQKRIV